MTGRITASPPVHHFPLVRLARRNSRRREVGHNGYHQATAFGRIAGRSLQLSCNGGEGFIHDTRCHLSSPVLPRASTDASAVRMIDHLPRANAFRQMPRSAGSGKSPGRILVIAPSSTSNRETASHVVGQAAYCPDCGLGHRPPPGERLDCPTRSECILTSGRLGARAAELG